VRIDIFTLFPDLVDAYCDASLLGRARRSGVVEVAVHDLRQSSTDERGTVDDTPFGGGAGMVLLADPVFRSVESVEGLVRPLFLLTPGGRPFTQQLAEELATGAGFSLLCGRYEGVDQRVADHLVDEELSIGDYVLAGGEAAALVVVEAVARLVPGTLGNEASRTEESFADGLLEYPQYTKPARFRSWDVPEVLRSGDHAKVADWRRVRALARTLERRPELIAARGGLRADEVALLRQAGEVHLLAEHGYDQ